MDCSIIISGLALAVSIYAYFAHDRKLKKQQKLLNELNIQKLKNENQEQQKADVRASLTIDRRDPQTMSISNAFVTYGRLEIKNYGKAPAYHIRVMGEYHRCGLNAPAIIDKLAPGESRFYNQEWDHYPSGMMAVCSWDDNFAKNRSNEIKLL